MTENYIKPEDVSPEDAQKVLDFLNSAESAEEIASAVEIPDERDVGIIVAQHILDRRKELGEFTNLQQVADVRQVGPERFTEIVMTLRGRQATEMIVVNRETLEAGLRKLEELRAQDPRWQEARREIERRFAEEKARRDAEYASKKTETQ